MLDVLVSPIAPVAAFAAELPSPAAIRRVAAACEALRSAFPPWPAAPTR